VSLELQDDDTFRHPRTEDGKLENLLQLEDNVGEIMEMLKWRKEEREKMGQASEGAVK
jgi:hypothetical protein